MKRFLFLVIFISIIIIQVFAQTAKITVSIKNEGNAASNIYAGEDYFSKYGTKGFGIYQKNGVFVKEFPIDKPMQFTISSQGGMENRYFTHYLLISPGDEIFISYDLNRNGEDLNITGKGAENNLFRSVNDINYFDYRFDEEPYRLLQVLKRNDSIDNATLSEYIKQYNPSDIFIKTKINALKYNNVFNFMGCYRDRLITRRIITKEWDHALDSIFKSAGFNKKDVSESHKGLASLYVDYKVIYNNTLERNNPVRFYTTFYKTLNVDSMKHVYDADKYNIVEEKIITDSFDIKTQDYLYYRLINRMINNSELNNFRLIVNNYRSKFPKSAYTKLLDKKINTTLESLRKKLTDKMVFVKGGANINSFDEVKDLFPNKTVFIDMWGTWCAPCLQAIEKNVPAFKTRFFGRKDLVVLYIANHDSKNAGLWKEKIAFYQMEGHHILANENLTREIMLKTKAQGFPAYIIINKEGAFKLLNNDSARNTDYLIKQIEENL